MSSPLVPVTRDPHDTTLYGDDPRLFDAPTHLAKWYRVIGYNVFFETNDERILRAADNLFNPLGWSTPPAERPDLHVQLLWHAPEEEPGWDVPIMVIRARRHLCTVVLGKLSHITMDLRDGYAMGFLSQSLFTEDRLTQEDFVYAAVMSWAFVRTHHGIHAAGIVRDGRSLLLRGLSGAGKSTLTYALLLRGFSLIDEDIVYVHPVDDPLGTELRHGRTGFFGVPWTMTLTPDTARFFPELTGCRTITRRSGEVKLLVDIGERFPDQMSPEAPAGPTVFIERSSLPRPRLTRLTQDETIRVLHHSRIAYEPTDTGDGSLWGLLLRYPAYILESSSDPHESAALLDEAFETDAFHDA